MICNSFESNPGSADLNGSLALAGSKRPNSKLNDFDGLEANPVASIEALVATAHLKEDSGRMSGRSATDLSTLAHPIALLHIDLANP